MSKLYVDGSKESTKCSVMASGFGSALGHEVVVRLVNYKYPQNKKAARRKGCCEVHVDSLIIFDDSR